ncbi:NPAT protein, partial [Nothocercus julius]|nr:NPAT protein [Nothocercus julius]
VEIMNKIAKFSFWFVAGYLQQEKLLATCREFILESSDLKEYAEHCTEDGFIPACLLSLCGKNLTTILNEYVAMKTKGKPPAKFDFSPFICHDYEPLEVGTIFLSIFGLRTTPSVSYIEIFKSPQVIWVNKPIFRREFYEVRLGLRVTQEPVTCDSSDNYHHECLCLNFILDPKSKNLFMVTVWSHQSVLWSGDFIHIQVPGSQERKLHSNLLSPGRRKSESQKRKNIGTSAPLSTSRSPQDTEEIIVEKESEPLQEFIDGNFPQLVIENAREKILSDKSLQEKLAENINKILSSDGSVTQAPKQTDSGPTEQETSIDEILGLQGEIHMSEEAIQDILEQTESDPAFQALFDLFDYGKNKVNKNLPTGISGQTGVENAILVDENNLETLESSLRTEETSKCDNSRESLSCKDFHLGEASCALKNSINDDMTKKNTANEQLHGNCRPKKQTEMLKTVTADQIGELEITFDSMPSLTESKRQSPDSECHEHCGDAYDDKEAAALVSGGERAVESGKDSLSHSAQSSPGLEYVDSGSSQISLVSLANGTAASGNRTLSGSKCHLLPDTSLSEKPHVKSPSDGSPGHSVLLRKNNSSIPRQSADLGKEQAATSDAAMLPGVLQQSCSHLSGCEDQGPQSDCAVRSAVKIPDLDKAELQLEVTEASNKPYSNDQHTLNKPCKKDFNLRTGLSNSEGAQVEMQEPSSSTKVDADNMFFSSGGACAEISVVPAENSLTTREMCHSPLPETTSSADEVATEAKSLRGVSSGSQPVDVDSSNIMSLKIIISDDPFISSDTELNNAVSSITGENLPTIILSSPAKSPTKTTGLSKCPTSEESEKPADSALAEQNLLVLRPKETAVSSANAPNEDCAVLSVAGATNLSKEGGFIQLMPATSTAFGSSNNLYIATCVADPAALGTAGAPSNVVVLPGSSLPLAAQAPAVQPLRTPPRPSNTFAANQAVSPSFPQGSAIIIASPVQPVLQGMVGMIPLSVVGQNGNTFSAPARQVLHMPVANPVCNRSVPKLPIPPKSQKIPGARNKANTGTCLASLRTEVAVLRMCQTGNSDKVTSAEVGRKAEENLPVAPIETVSSNSRPSESHRRVLCFDNVPPTPGGNTQIQTAKSIAQKERNENTSFAVDSASASAKAPGAKREKDKTLPRILCKPEAGGNRGSSAKEPQPERKAGAAGLPLDAFHKATANKENELRRAGEDKQRSQEAAKLSNGQQGVGLWNEKTAASVPELSKKQGPLANGSSKAAAPVSLSSKEPKREAGKAASPGLCLASPFTKQCVEMLQDMQWHSPAGKAAEHGELPVPRTPPASETGSENSVSMAAHTLMILSRAAMARSSGASPLKESAQQLRPARAALKKRKLEELSEGERNPRAAGRRDLQGSPTPSKKKKIKKKKLPNSFPAGMDVDKFLLSLHYDE